MNESIMIRRHCVEFKGASGRVVYIIPVDIFEHILAAAVRTIRVDEVWYLQKYADVAEAVRTGRYRNALDHYARFGFKENRQPYEITVDEDFYLAQNSDVAKAVLKGDFASGQAHFDQAGFSEGRLPYAQFRLFRGT
jgi:hypothetical protein